MKQYRAQVLSVPAETGQGIMVVTEADALAHTEAEVAKAVEKERKEVREWWSSMSGKGPMWWEVRDYLASRGQPPAPVCTCSESPYAPPHDKDCPCYVAPQASPLEAPRDVNVPSGWFKWAEQITAAVNELRKEQGKL